MGVVSTTFVIRGKKIRLKESFAEGDMKSFKAASAKLSDDSQRMRKAALVETKATRQSYRKGKISKNA